MSTPLKRESPAMSTPFKQESSAMSTPSKQESPTTSTPLEQESPATSTPLKQESPATSTLLKRESPAMSNTAPNAWKQNTLNVATSDAQKQNSAAQSNPAMKSTKTFKTNTSDAVTSSLSSSFPRLIPPGKEKTPEVCCSVNCSEDSSGCGSYGGRPSYSQVAGAVVPGNVFCSTPKTDTATHSALDTRLPSLGSDEDGGASQGSKLEEKLTFNDFILRSTKVATNVKETQKKKKKKKKMTKKKKKSEKDEGIKEAEEKPKKFLAENVNMKDEDAKSESFQFLVEDVDMKNGDTNSESFQFLGEDGKDGGEDNIDKKESFDKRIDERNDLSKFHQFLNEIDDGIPVLKIEEDPHHRQQQQQKQQQQLKTKPTHCLEEASDKGSCEPVQLYSSPTSSTIADRASDEIHMTESQKDKECKQKSLEEGRAKKSTEKPRYVPPHRRLQGSKKANPENCSGLVESVEFNNLPTSRFRETGPVRPMPFKQFLLSELPAGFGSFRAASGRPHPFGVLGEASGYSSDASTCDSFGIVRDRGSPFEGLSGDETGSGDICGGAFWGGQGRAQYRDTERETGVYLRPRGQKQLGNGGHASDSDTGFDMGRIFYKSWVGREGTGGGRRQPNDTDTTENWRERTSGENSPRHDWGSIGANKQNKHLMHIFQNELEAYEIGPLRPQTPSLFYPRVPPPPPTPQPSHYGHNKAQAIGRGGPYPYQGLETSGVLHENQTRKPKIAYLSFTRLVKLNEAVEEDVVISLSCLKEGLWKRLNDFDLASNTRMMQLLLRCLVKTCHCSSMPAQRDEILGLVMVSVFLRVLGKFLAGSTRALPTAEVKDVIGNCYKLMSTLLSLDPATMLFDVFAIRGFIAEVQERMTVAEKEEKLPNEITDKNSELELAKNTAYVSLESRMNRKGDRVPIDEDSQAPPEDFRTISVIPSLQELKTTEFAFLRKNKQTGGYSCPDHYLDVQFRLLREDFVYPLRKGIAEYLASLATKKERKRLKNIRVYHDVCIVRSTCLPSHLGHRLSFDVSTLRGVDWKRTKRLSYGALVCLSPDNFNTLYFATVACREPGDLREGLVDVVFEHNLQEISAIRPDTLHVMAETTALFEAYRHVLLGLQRIEHDPMPFQKYIVHCERKVSSPRYFTKAVGKPLYDMRPLLDETEDLSAEDDVDTQNRMNNQEHSPEWNAAARVSVMDKTSWPSASLWGVDETQFQAVYSALTKELSIIQGPPGTGKTYTGLKIVQALLHNRTFWDPDQSGCMLVVCYTNHALDQFLQGIVSFYQGQVIRVGNRLQNACLAPYTLSNARWRLRRARDEQDDAYRMIRKLSSQDKELMDGLNKELSTMGLKIEIAKREILHENVLRPYMLKKHYDSLMSVRDQAEDSEDKKPAKGDKKPAEEDKKPAEEDKKPAEGENKPVVKPSLIADWLGLSPLLQNAEVTAEEVQVLHEELVVRGEDKAEEEELMEEAEEMFRLDIEDVDEDVDVRKKRQIEEREYLTSQRSRYIAVDISKLNQLTWKQKPDEEKKGQQVNDFKIPKEQLKNVKEKLRLLVSKGPIMTEAEEQQVDDLWSLDKNAKWRYYRMLVERQHRNLWPKMKEKDAVYADLAKQHQETLMQEDRHILKNATVIAMTTTAAARYQAVLQAVKPKVIVVEEAAEVLEGHVITTLNTNCEHLVLIGDHKQLKPNPTVYALVKKYNLDLSFFERMINNGLKHDMLGWQHRMRPEIATLLKPVYPTLQNSPIVEQFEDVVGVSTNVYFMDHRMPEMTDEDNMSHYNLFEAHYLAELCEYLLKQGYSPSQITVLATYSGQVHYLRRLIPAGTGVYVTVVDKFQGQENDIILLSLVRSNQEGNIGFLKIDNRICVALSRAKMALYAIGNMEALCGVSSLWQAVATKLRKKGQLGEALHLYCQKHPQDAGSVIRTPTDFMNKTPDGGCCKPCPFRLECGHVCRLKCHPFDPEHVKYECNKPCNRKMTCEFGHPCKKLCHEECGDCEETVERTMPDCGHLQQMSCSIKVEKHICQEPCTVVLDCGHLCADVCGEPHICFEKILHTWPCGHEAEIYCMDRDTTPCLHPCQTLLSCEHWCEGTCSECSQGRLHKRCSSHCKNILVCGHPCEDICTKCPSCPNQCENRCVHSSCQNRCGLPCTPCKEPCAWECPHYSCSQLCSELCDRPPCNEPCPKQLECGHQCIGLCGEPCPRLCGICNAENVKEIFFGTEEDPGARFMQLEDCGHVLEVSGLDFWMTTRIDQHEDSVQLKACPYCSTAIRRNLRYGTVIKTQLKDIEAVKAKIQGDEEQRKEFLSALRKKIGSDTDMKYREAKTAVLEAGDQETHAGLLTMENQIKLLDQIKTLDYDSYNDGVSCASFVEHLEQFELWISNPRAVFSDQEVQDAETEVQRLIHWLDLLRYRDAFRENKWQMPVDVASVLDNTLLWMEKGQAYEIHMQFFTSDLLDTLKSAIPETGLGISEIERVMIVRAMGLSQGQWFKCPEGHVYAIGECGGAMEESRCPDCQAAIGGTQHRLLLDNSLATEMDGAEVPAWPSTLFRHY